VKLHAFDLGRAFGVVWILPLALEVSAAGQGPGFTARANLVSVPVVVRDASGNAVYGLDANDFIIEDDGVQETVHLDGRADAEPLSLVIAVERGRRASREFSRIGTLASMLDPILTNPDNEAALVLFDSRLDLARDFTNRGDDIESSLRNLAAGDNGARILDAVAYCARLLSKRDSGRRRVLLVVSETRDHGSKFSRLDDVIRRVGENDVLVFAAVFSPYISKQLDAARGANRDEWTAQIDLVEKLAAARQALRKNMPRALAAMTGGEYQLFLNRNEFENDLAAFSNHLDSRYELSFEPDDPHPGFHRIGVRLRSPGKDWSVVYRSSYWAAPGR